MRDWRIGWLAAILLGLLTTAAAAQPRAYMGLDLLYWRYHEDAETDLRASTLRGRLGSEFGRYFGLEVHAAAGGKDNGRRHGLDVEAELDWLGAVFGRLALPLGACCNVYALGGGARGRAVVDDGTLAVTQSASSWAYGGGAEVLIVDNVYLSGEWLRYLDEADYSFGGWTFGGRWRF